jgi:t-SNARE complex subunit (syntaxin)
MHEEWGRQEMSKRFVKKEEVERQLQEIFQLIQQVDEKMEEVIAEVIEERYEQSKMQLDQLQEQLTNVERQLHRADAGHEPELPLPSNLYFV